MIAVSWSFSSRKPSCPNFEVISWYFAPGMHEASSFCSQTGKSLSLSMPITVQSALIDPSAFSTPPLQALIEFEKEPKIEPNGEIKLTVKVRQTGCASYRRMALKWYTPEGFSVAGKTNLFSKWMPHFGGSVLENVKETGNEAEVTITAGEKVEPVNRLVLEITCPNLCQPLLVPVTILG